MIEKGFHLQPGFFPNYYPGCALAAAPAGVDPDTLNCRISICPQNSMVQVSKADASVGYATVDTDCRPANAGGQYLYEDDSWTLQISNNPDYDPPRKQRSLETEDRGHSRDFAKRQQPGVSLTA